MKKNKKYSIIRLFSSLSSTRKNEIRPFTPKPVDDNKARPEQRDPAEMQIDELFARFTAAINKRGSYSR